LADCREEVAGRTGRAVGGRLWVVMVVVVFGPGTSFEVLVLVMVDTEVTVCGAGQVAALPDSSEVMVTVEKTVVVIAGTAN
jgi:hypothetical protein